MGRDSFPTTHWSRILLASHRDRESGLSALEQLLRAYSAPILAYLKHRFALSQEDASDLFQAFVERKILRDDLLEQADPKRGRFRTILRVSLAHFVIDNLRSRDGPTRRPKAGTVPLESLPELAENNPGPNVFDQQWARAVFEAAAQRTRAACEAKRRNNTWLVFEKAFLCADGKRPSDAQLASQHGFNSARQVSNAMLAAKKEFGRQLCRVLSQYARDAEEIKQEIRDLMRVVSQMR